MADRKFRFGAVVAAAGNETASSWLAQVKRVEELGFSSLLVPDGVRLLSPFSSMAVAAATTSLTVAPMVLASPLREPGLAAWEGHSLAVLSGGRFEFGVGSGRPSMAEEAPVVGGTYGTGGQRLARMIETVRRFRELDGDAGTPVLVAARGPKALEFAAAEADIITLAAGALEDRATLVELVKRVRADAGDRADEIAFSTNVMVVGDDAPGWVSNFLGADVPTLIKHESLAVLHGTEQQMADELRRRRDELGISYVGIGGAEMERFAPLVEKLTGT